MAENTNNEYFHRINTHCIFCAKEVHQNEAVNRNFPQPTGELGDDEYDQEKAVERHRLSVTMAGKILGVENSVKQKQLREFGPTAAVDRESPDFWVRICLSCNEFVEDHIASKREIARLERGAKKIELKLKEFIVTSNQEGKDDKLLKKGKKQDQVIFRASKEIRHNSKQSRSVSLQTQNLDPGTINWAVLSNRGQPVKRKFDSLDQPPSTLEADVTQSSSSAISSSAESGGETGSETTSGSGDDASNDEDEEEYEEKLYMCKICEQRVFKREELDAHRYWHKKILFEYHVPYITT
ncbi:unnamed protein product [Orchesella dallaii]|uniref:C2H2-type domain-containing protein n=1 Tax=Orchesella dallaii TaxID=48710 RepID=A0ABP1R6T8_9HEXA